MADPDFDVDEEILKGAEERAEKATPGPWKVKTHGYDSPYMVKAFVEAPSDCIAGAWESDPTNLAFIAAARTDIPALAAIARKYQRALKILWDAMVLDFHPGDDEAVDPEPCAYCKAKAEVRRILEGGE